MVDVRRRCARAGLAHAVPPVKPNSVRDKLEDHLRGARPARRGLRLVTTPVCVEGTVTQRRARRQPPHQGPGSDPKLVLERMWLLPCATCRAWASPA